jgi:hypothetical protein
MLAGDTGLRVPHEEPSVNRRERRAEARRLAAARPSSGAGRSGASTPTSQAPVPPSVVGLLPGALMLRLQTPPGVPQTDTARVRQVGCLGGAPALALIPEDERNAITESLGKTLRRGEYHYQRLVDLRRSLDTRRDGLPGEVFWDPLTEAVHFELQAFCGASRMALDELVYLIARRHGVAEAASKEAVGDQRPNCLEPCRRERLRRARNSQTAYP